MKYVDCFKYLASRRRDELVVTSAGNSGQAWWAATGGDTTSSFYLGASMSLSSMFATGLAFARPELKIWVFMGDGAFCMNPGMLFVEREMNPPNLVHFLVSNGRYGATGNAPLPNRQMKNDYPAIARAMGLQRVFSFDNLDSLASGFDAVVTANNPGHTFVTLEVEPFSEAERHMPYPPMDGPEMKYRFGRKIEEMSGADIFGYRV